MRDRDPRLGISGGLLASLFVATAALANPPGAHLSGRILARGGNSPLAGVEIQTAAGDEALSDADGRFELSLPAGRAALVLSHPQHEPLRVVEELRAGEGLRVEYRLAPLPPYRRRYETVVRGEARHEGERFSLRAEELTQLPGSLGDPYRAVALLPGVGTPIPLLPMYVIRGASPGMNGFFLDGMRVPQLFHFLVGGAVVHPRLVERLDFYPGAYDASFGRYAGGIIDSETRSARPGWHGEAELRLFDASALVEGRLPGDLRILVAGRYGYPGPLIHLAAPTVNTDYWDYQLRADWRGLTLEALGSHDFVSARELPITGALRGLDYESWLEFHRLQLRHRQRFGRLDIEAAIVGGIDDMAVLSGQGVRKLSLAARLNGRARWKRFTLYAGLDGELSRFAGQRFTSPPPSIDDPMLRGDAPDQLGELAAERDGLVAGAFLQGSLDLLPRRFNVTLGGRADVYHAGSVTLLGIDPRLTYRAKLGERLSLTGGVGLFQQPPSFPVALPGIDTYALQIGLQRAWQGASGLEVTLPWHSTFGATGYFQRYFNANDVVADWAPTVCTAPPVESLSGLPAILTHPVDGHSFGMELLLRRHAGRLTGWIAYTLSRSERIYSCGLRPADFDQTHMLNVVAQVRLPWNLMAGARFYYATGRPFTNEARLLPGTEARNNDRLPDYVQLDLRLDREWLFRRWALSAFLEVVNTTYSQTILAVTPRLAFNWILPSIGLRGRF